MSANRPAALALPIGLAIGALLTVLGVLRASAPDDEGLRGSLARELERLDAWPSTDPIGKDHRIEELLAVEDYQKFARGLWTKVDRLHGPAHQAARAQVAAARVVPGFLDRCRNLDTLSSEALRTLDEEARALQNEHRSTSFAPALQDARDRIAARIAARTPACTDADHYRVFQEMQKERLQGRFGPALRRMNEATAKHSGCADLLATLKLERDKVLQSATAAAEKLLKETWRIRGEGRPGEAARLLEQALPNYEGVPEEGRLRALLKELRRS